MLITISNRLPVSASRRDNALVFESSVGGLDTGLGQFSKSGPSAWVGWPGLSLASTDSPEAHEIHKRLLKDSCHPVFLSSYEVENYYHGFSNRTIWPLFHYFPLHASYSRTFWNAYRKVNEKFADAAARIVRILGDPDLGRRLGTAGRETVRRKFLITRLLGDYLDLLADVMT